MTDLTTPGPTPHPAVNDMIRALQTGIQDVLGDDLIGLYLDGSLALGDFDADSDIDFVAVVPEEIEADSPRFSALHAMHARLSQMRTPWAVQIEGSYFSARALRKHSDALIWHPNIERGAGEQLKMNDHDATWDIHRQVLRTHGIVLAGPLPKSLIDPITPEQLRSTMRSAGLHWLDGFLSNPKRINTRGYQSYLTLSICRMRYTLATGQIVSKAAAAAWARMTLGEPWDDLIARAWISRSSSNAGDPVDPDQLRQSLLLIRKTLAEA